MDKMKISVYTEILEKLKSESNDSDLKMLEEMDITPGSTHVLIHEGILHHMNGIHSAFSWHIETEHLHPFTIFREYIMKAVKENKFECLIC